MSGCQSLSVDDRRGAEEEERKNPPPRFDEIDAFGKVYARYSVFKVDTRTHPRSKV